MMENHMEKTMDSAMETRSLGLLRKLKWKRSGDWDYTGGGYVRKVLGGLG